MTTPDPHERSTCKSVSILMRLLASFFLVAATCSSRFLFVASFTAAASGGGGGGGNTWRSGIRNPPVWSSDRPPPGNDAILDHAIRGITSTSFSGSMEAVLDATRDLCRTTPCRRPDQSRGESGLAFLFVSPQYNVTFPDIVRTAHEELGEDVALLSVVGSAVIGGGVESDGERGISLLCGILPPTADAEVFRFGPDEEDDEEDDDDNRMEKNKDPPIEVKDIRDAMGIIAENIAEKTRAIFEAEEAKKKKGLPPATSPYWNLLGRNQKMPSYVVFADSSAPIEEILDGLDSSGSSCSAVVAGGLANPCFVKEGNTGFILDDLRDLPNVAVNGKVFPPSSCVGVALTGSVGLQTVLAQGCRPVGPAFGVTKAKGFQIFELEHKEATAVVKDNIDLYLTEEEIEIVKKQGLCCGLADRSSNDVKRGDYFISQMSTNEVVQNFPGGKNYTSIGVLGSKNSIQEGDIFRLHVRDEPSAREDIDCMTMRVKTERSFVTGSERIGVPLAALQIASYGRGRNLFGDDSPNFDLNNIQKMVGEDAPVAGFFARGEISPLGVSGIGLTDTAKQTYIHQFSTVAAMVCDFSSDNIISAEADRDNAGAEDDFSAWE